MYLIVTVETVETIYKYFCLSVGCGRFYKSFTPESRVEARVKARVLCYAVSAREYTRVFARASTRDLRVLFCFFFVIVAQ